jgi:hypothetical protein
MATVLEARPDHAGFKAYRQGTHRTVDPASTLARVQPYLARMGITRIANVTGCRPSRNVHLTTTGTTPRRRAILVGGREARPPDTLQN